MDALKSIWAAYKGPIIGGGAGFIIALLLIQFGFFKTLLIAILSAIGVGIGTYLQLTGYLGNQRN